MPKSESLVAHTRPTPSYDRFISAEAKLAPVEEVEASGFALIVSGVLGDTQRNRCANKLEEFGYLGLPADAALSNEVLWDRILPHYQMFILHQVQNSSQIEEFIKAAKAAGKPLIFDADDPVFDARPDRLGPIARNLGPRELQFYKDVVYRIGRTLELCDSAIVSTIGLKEAVHELFPGKPVYVHPNAASEKLCQLAETVRGQYVRPDHGLIRVSFVAGSGDLTSCAGGLCALLKKYPEVRLITVGEIDVPQELAERDGQVEAVPAVPWYHLPLCYAMADLNLAPVKADPLAALMERPTVATVEELEALILDRGLRARRGQAARADALEHGTTRALSPQLKEIVEGILGKPAIGRLAVKMAAPQCAEGD